MGLTPILLLAVSCTTSRPTLVRQLDLSPRAWVEERAAAHGVFKEFRAALESRDVASLDRILDLPQRERNQLEGGRPACKEFFWGSPDIYPDSAGAVVAFEIRYGCTDGSAQYSQLLAHVTTGRDAAPLISAIEGLGERHAEDREPLAALESDAGSTPHRWGAHLKHGRFFQRHRPLTFCFRGRGLDERKRAYTLLPLGYPCAYLWFDEAGIHYLNRRNRASLERLLASEGRPLDQADPWAFASFLSEVLLRDGNKRYVVIGSVDEIRGIGELGGLRSTGYVVSDVEVARVASEIHPPRLTASLRSGWSIEFFTLAGWMHDTREVSRHRVVVSPDFSLDHQEETLSERIFTSVPRIVY